jgi:hypothetical protein
MADRIRWLTDLDEGINRARREGKAILLDFHNPG